jgi:uncharacterized protein YdiU (UPF0061 family)
MAYWVYNRKVVQEKGLDKGLLRVFKLKAQAKTFTSDNPDAYIVKKAKEEELHSVKQVYSGYQDGEWANQFYAYRFKVDGKEVEVTTDLTKKGDWRVVWDGAVDYDGNKAGLLKRYPEFKKHLR